MVDRKKQNKLHYKQIQYEFCSKEHPPPSLAPTHKHKFLYMYSIIIIIIMARYWDQMKAQITSSLEN